MEVFLGLGKKLLPLNLANLVFEVVEGYLDGMRVENVLPNMTETALNLVDILPCGVCKSSRQGVDDTQEI